ncbi:hypothetical protein EYF80_033007 [Liparis tanakae]|uniref:Uncharacterized protein n=1 Tax=Liparis tanakae TaxID=230148 RepID=A0A4Z2GTL7_9TELE|nr:hypothetical protein EYF80_033007 [Liparis tanakae]
MKRVGRASPLDSRTERSRNYTAFRTAGSIRPGALELTSICVLVLYSSFVYSWIDRNKTFVLCESCRALVSDPHLTRGQLLAAVERSKSSTSHGKTRCV